jgi:hypothetical protein
VTTIKKAAGKDWSWTSLERAAGYLTTKRDELDGLNTAEIHARLLEVNKAGLTRAGNRGSSIHALIEARAAGKTLLAEEMTPEAADYIPAVDAFLDECQPEWLLSEVVIVNRTVGYGGTGDAGIVIDGRRYFVDWKTRRSADKHNAYDEECWQVAAYMMGEYMIVDRDGHAVRERVPAFDGGLIVSLAPEGYRLYPIDVEKSWESFQDLAAFAARKGRTFHGKPLSVPRGGQRSLNAMMRAASPAYVPPDEGEMVTDADYAALEAAFNAMSSDLKMVMTSWVTEGKAAGRHWKLSACKSVRRFECYRAALALLDTWQGNADYTRACLAVVLGDLQLTDTIGGLIGGLTTEQAISLTGVAKASSDGHAAAFTADGVLYWSDADALRNTAA